MAENQSFAFRGDYLDNLVVEVASIAWLCLMIMLTRTRRDGARAISLAIRQNNQF